MKRLHLFEFEDFSWFPSRLRNCLTRYLQMIHRLLDSAPDLAKLLDDILKNYSHRHIIDLCSGSGRPMLEVVEILKSEYGYPDVTLALTDLHPNHQAIKSIQDRNGLSLKYYAEPVDATSIDNDMAGVRTLVCGLHHMNPSMALDVVLQQIPSENYGWIKGRIPGKVGPKLYLCGGPKTDGFTLAV